MDSGQRLDNVNRIHLVLGSGKLVLQKTTLASISGHVLRVCVRRAAGVRGRQLHVLGRARQEEEEGEEAAREGGEGELGHDGGHRCTGHRQRISW